MTHRVQDRNDPASDTIRDAWDAIAAGYDAYVTPTHMRLANEALDHLDLQPGDRFLDVAAGSGALSLTAARRGARVLGTDIAPAMIERLNDNARRAGLTNLTGQVMDGHNLQLGDNSFDCAGSMFGVMLFTDLPRGLSEMARVTTSGGHVLVVTFGPPQEVEFLGFFLSAVRKVAPDYVGLPMDPPPLPFQVSDPNVLGMRMTEAALTKVSVETTVETLQFASADDLWKWLANSNPIGAMLTGSLSPDQAADVRETLNEMLRERAGGSATAQLNNPINIAVGTA